MSNPRRILVLIPAAVILIALAMILWPAKAGRARSSPDPAPAEAAAPAKTENAATRTIKPSQEDIIKRLVFTGELRAQQSIQISVPRISSAFSSTITFLAPEGAPVRRGDRIVEFDASSLLSSKSEAERKLDEAKLTIEKKKADLEADRTDLLNGVAQAEANLQVAELYGKIPQELLPVNDYKKYQLNVETAKLSLQKAKEQLANFEKAYAAQMALVEIDQSQAEIDLKKIQSDLTLLTINAPQDGILIYGDNWANNRKIQIGDALFPGMPAVELPDLNTMQVIGFVYDTELSFLSPGQRCTVGLDGVPGSQFQASVVSLTSVAGRKSFASQQKVFKALIKLDKVDLATMKPGMTTHVEIPIKLASRVLTVPRDFLGLDSQGRYYVLKQKDQKNSEVVHVQIGVMGDSTVEIVSGASSSDSLLPVQKVWEDQQ